MRARRVHAYEQAIAADPTLLDAHINLGRLLHEGGRFTRTPSASIATPSKCVEPIRCCCTTSACCSTTWVAKRDAIASVRGGTASPTPPSRIAITTWRCCTKTLQKPKDAIRHMAQYRRLLRKS